MHPTGLRLAAGLEQTQLEAVVGGMREAGAVDDVLQTGEVALNEAEDQISLYERVARENERHKQFERSRVEMVRAYAELRDCRRGYVLNYFGQGFEEPCGRCDNCEAGVVLQEDEEDRIFPLGRRVAHEKWGEGAVNRYEGDDKIVVLFDEVGYKSLVVALVEEHGLLEPVDQDLRRRCAAGSV